MGDGQVAATKTLITPVQCKSLWRQFKAETDYTVTQAISAQVRLTCEKITNDVEEIFKCNIFLLNIGSA